MAFINAPSIVSYTATAGQTDFEFGFKWFNTTDIIVYQVPEGEPSGDDKILDPNLYTITPVGANIGGSIILDTGAVDLDTIIILRKLPIVRTVEYALRGDLRASTIDTDQNYQTYLLQDLDALKYQFLQVPPGTPISPNFPYPVSDAYIKYNAAGDALETDTTIPDAVIFAEDSNLEAASWANENEDVPVKEYDAGVPTDRVPTVFSSKSHAIKSNTSATQAQLDMWNTEAEKLNADSYATEAEDVEVNNFVSNNDGTFTVTPIPSAFSSLHYSIKSAEAAAGLNYQGLWDASGGVYPTTRPPEGTGLALKAADLFIVSVAGDIGGVQWTLRDWMIRNATNDGWDRVPQVVDWNNVVNVPVDVTNGTNPIGAIIMYNGAVANIPANWQLCDGTSGTPNMTDNFVMGTNTEANIGLTGGSNDAVNIAHGHTATFVGTALANHSHAIGKCDGCTLGGGYVKSADTRGSGNTSADGASAGTPAGSVAVVNSGVAGTNLNRPAFVQLAYIQRMS